MTSHLIRMEPVWVGGKLVYPEGWISPETRELMAKAQADCEAAQAAMKERADSMQAASAGNGTSYA